MKLLQGVITKLPRTVTFAVPQIVVSADEHLTSMFYWHMIECRLYGNSATEGFTGKLCASCPAHSNCQQSTQGTQAPETFRLLTSACVCITH